MIINVQYDEETDDYFIQFPNAMMKELDWKTGDVLNWKDNGDGSFTISKPTTE